MPKIAHLETGFYRVPLPTILTDSMHGEMRAFELQTVRVRDADGAEGMGYTFTVGRNGGAIASILRDELPDIVKGEDADHIERLWNKIWWATHYGGRGGPTVLALSAFDIALWDLKARRAKLPLWNLLGGNDPDFILQCLRAGASDFLMQPFTAEQIEGAFAKTTDPLRITLRHNLSRYAC